MGGQEQGREGWEELSVGGNEGGEEAQEDEEEAAEGRPRGGDDPRVGQPDNTGKTILNNSQRVPFEDALTQNPPHQQKEFVVPKSNILSMFRACLFSKSCVY